MPHPVLLARAENNFSSYRADVNGKVQQHQNNHAHLEIISFGRCFVRRKRNSSHAFLFLCEGLLLPCVQKASVPSLASDQSSANAPSPKAPVIVVGFVGGFVRHDNAAHSPVQLAAHLRETYASGVYVEVFENRRREQAHQEILKLLDLNHDGALSEEEKRDARVIIYGMSWGGSETVALARELGERNIPVLLTIQVDSVTKMGQNDSLIPANVAEAVNFYQADGLLHGQSEIRAADPSRTRILGNFRFDYASKSLQCEKYPWYDRLLAKQHTEIECDPAVWKQVESLIRSKLPPARETAAAQR